MACYEDSFTFFFSLLYSKSRFYIVLESFFNIQEYLSHGRLIVVTDTQVKVTLQLTVSHYVKVLSQFWDL
jgi:hypothetical protein